MQPGALRALEFDRIVEAVRDFALTPMGAERLAGLQPSTDARHGRAAAGGDDRNDAVSSRRTALFPLRASSELPQILDALAVEGRALEALRLLALADVPRFGRRGARRHPPRARIVSAARGRERRRRVVQGRDGAGRARRSIRPARSSTTRARSCKLIRERLRKQRTRLRSTLESYLRGKDTAKYLQDQVVTERNGRYVLVVKAEHRSGIPGIVHGASTSGASLFLEPLSTVEINNDIVALEEQEARRSPPHPAGADRRVPPARRRPAADDRGGDRARRAAGARALLRIDRRHRAGAVDRRRVRAAGGAASAAQEPGAGHDQDDPAGDDPARSPGRTPAARPSR